MRSLKQVYTFLRVVFAEFNDDNGGLVAAAMAFYGLLSLIPLLLLAISVLGYAIGSERAFSSVVESIRDYFPVGTESLRENLAAIRESSGVAGGIGLLGLLWTGSQIFVILQKAMNIPLDVRWQFGFLKTRLRALALVLVAGVFFLLSIGITWIITAIRAFDLRVWGITNGIEPIWNLLATLAPIVFSLVMFFLIYKFLPTVDMGIVGPLIAGISAGLLFELAKWLFGLYATHFGSFTAIYGSIGGAVILMLWIYYVSLITVIGAEIAAVYRKGEEARESRSG
jgi:membrane protein